MHYFKSKVYGGNLFNSEKLKDSIYRHVCNIPPDMLRANVEKAEVRFHLHSENGGRHIVHAF